MIIPIMLHYQKNDHTEENRYGLRLENKMEEELYEKMEKVCISRTGDYYDNLYATGTVGCGVLRRKCGSVSLWGRRWNRKWSSGWKRRRVWCWRIGTGIRWCIRKQAGDSGRGRRVRRGSCLCWTVRGGVCNAAFQWGKAGKNICNPVCRCRYSKSSGSFEKERIYFQRMEYKGRQHWKSF